MIYSPSVSEIFGYKWNKRRYTSKHLFNSPSTGWLVTCKFCSCPAIKNNRSDFFVMILVMIEQTLPISEKEKKSW